MKKIKNKKGWMKIVEAFIAILLIMGVVILVLERDYNEGADISAKVYSTQISLLEELALNSDDKAEILSGNEVSINDKIDLRTPNYLDCDVRICDVEDDCELVSDKETIYVQAIIVTEEGMDSKKLRLFCWIK